MVNLIHVVGQNAQRLVRLVIQNRHYKLNPVVETPWFDQEGQQSQSVAHVEDLGNGDQLLELLLSLDVLDSVNHDALQLREKGLSDLDEDFSFVIVDFELKSSNQLFQRVKTYHLRSLVVDSGKSLLNLGNRAGPESLFEVCLRDVINHILEFRAEDAKL